MAPNDNPGEGSGPEGTLGGGIPSPSKAKGPPKGNKKTPVLDAARVGARVNVEGMQSVINLTKTWLGDLRQIRAELDGINAAAAGFPGVGGGSGGGGSDPARQGTNAGTSNPNASRFSAMTNQAKGAFGIALATSAVSKLTGMASDRFNRNLNESIPISQNNMLLASQYQYQYSSLDWNRVKAMGNFNMSRGDTAAALNIGLHYGQSAQQGMNFLSQTVAPLVQASGGTLAPSAAAATAGNFLGAQTMRRAISLGIAPGRIGGQVQNPLTTAQGYITDYEKRMGVQMNDIDFQNMLSPGSSHRMRMKQIYALSDEAIDMVIQAGQQNNMFRSKTGGRNINFSNTADLGTIGMKNDRLGLKAFQYLSASAKRESGFFQRQEQSMVGKLGQDITIEDTLAKVENAFSGLIGPMGEFQRYIGIATSALQAMAGINLAGAFMGGGGKGVLGGIGNFFKGGGGTGAVATAAGAGEGGAAAGGVAAAAGGGSFLPMGAGVGVAGAAIGIGGGMLAANYGGSHGGLGGALVGIGGGAAGGALAGASIAGAPGAVVGGIVGGVYGATKYFDGMHKRDVARAARGALSMGDDALTAAISKNHGNPLAGDFGSGILFGTGPGETGQFDVWQMRRGALLAAALQEMVDNNVFTDLKPDDAQKLMSAIGFFGSDSVKNDLGFGLMGKGVQGFLSKYAASGRGRDIFTKYFGSTVKTPFDLVGINTPEAQGLVVSEADQTSAILGTGSSKSGDPISGKGAGGATWDRLDGAFKGPLTQLLQAAGGKVWLGNGWRSGDQQKKLFLDRHHVDPNGSISWNGQRWTLNKGQSPAAPPGDSMHELGRAADLEGDLSWVQANAAKYGLKTFGGVNGEPWHVQLSSDPNSRSDYEKNGGGSAGSSTDGTASTTSSMMMMGATLSVNSGVNFSLAASRPNSGGGMYGGTAGTSTSGALTGGSSAAGGTYSAQQVAQFAYNAGFHGSDLVNFVAIAMRESGGNAGAHNETGPDLSYGLFQINLKPWADKGTAAPYTKEQLYDPQFNANVAFQYFQTRGMQPWDIKGNPLARTDQGAAASAVTAAGLGDPFTRGGGGSGFVYTPTNNFSIMLSSTGNLQYDANALAQAAADKLNQDMAMAVRRKS